ncbi:hypothetical protein DERP_010782 [Dermatophagoides pteronyssinus]|uniref:Uncharacterized protein n=1 Tax=Dermatophagoides pteronyssinus TaxID=6956 RepID=A0ABQ8J6N6_DERPT|nr:hypothetical protein DERP_010782 [Dermatophagoides pteronyssinus]
MKIFQQLFKYKHLDYCGCTYNPSGFRSRVQISRQKKCMTEEGFLNNKTDQNDDDNDDNNHLKKLN